MALIAHEHRLGRICRLAKDDRLQHDDRPRAAMGLAICVAAWLVAADAAGQEPRASFPVEIRVDAAHPLGELKPIYRFFGADEPNYGTMKDGRKLIAELGKL